MRFKRYRCGTCAHIYNEATGDPISGVAPGTRFDDLQDKWSCSVCGAPRERFESAGMSGFTLAATRRNSNRERNSRNQEEDPIVIVGAGIGGWYIAEQLRQNGVNAPIAIVTKDDGDYYYKPHLSASITRKSRADLILTKGPERAQLLDVDLHARTLVLGLDRKKKRLLTNKNKTECGKIKYAKLVLATGAVPFRLYDRRIQQHLHHLNDLDQYESLTELLNDGRKRVLILGAGLIGCELGDHLARAGHEVAINDRAPYLQSSLLTDGVSTDVHERQVPNGIEFLLGTTMNDVVKQDGGLQIQFEDGRAIERDVVISAIGLKPNVDLAARAGLDVGRGIKVDATLRTSDPDIYAIGDCAEHKGQVFSFVECINRQAAVIVNQLGGGGKQRFESRACVGSITSFLPAGSSCLRPSRAVPDSHVNASYSLGHLANVVTLRAQARDDDREKATALTLSAPGSLG